MKNIPDVKLGIAAVSRDCFPMSLSASRCEAVVKACKEIGVDVFKCPTTIESETHMMQALEELKAQAATHLLYTSATSALSRLKHCLQSTLTVL